MCLCVGVVDVCFLCPCVRVLHEGLCVSVCVLGDVCFIVPVCVSFA